MGLNTKCPLHGNAHPDFLCPNRRKTSGNIIHNEFKKLVAEWDRGYALSKDEKKAVVNHLMECDDCEKMLLRKHVLVESIKK